MPELYFENTITGTRFKVTKFDKEGGTVTLVGKHGIPFVEEYTTEKFKRLGYVPRQYDAAPTNPVATAVPGAPPPPPAG